jgi:two-component system, cell cycle response regulator
MLRDSTVILQNRIKDLKGKLHVALELSQKNLSAFQKFKNCSQEIQSTTSLDHLPGVLKSIRSRLRLQALFLVLAEEYFAGFVPPSIQTRPIADLKSLMVGMGVDKPGVQPIMNSMSGMRHIPSNIRSFLPESWNRNQDGSVCIFFLADKYHPETVIGLLCLADGSPERFHADMATDFIEYFADSFAWTLVTLREHEKLIRENTLDQLTGCHNRTYLCKHAPRILDFAQRKDFPVALLFIDLDKFKAINDTMGHSCGDLVLIAISERIRGIVREYDIVVRLGGDEFLVLLPDVDQQTAQHTAKRIQEAIQSVDVTLVCGQAAKLEASASIGVAMYERGQGLEQFIARADACMYAVKQTRGSSATSQEEKL